MTTSDDEPGWNELVVALVRELEEVVLGPDGWVIEVTFPANDRGDAKVELSHGLVPVVRSYCSQPSSLRGFVVSGIGGSRSMRLVHDHPIETEHIELVRGLLSAAGWPRGQDADEAVVSIAHLLAETEVLSEAEADWIEAMVDALREEGAASGGVN